MKDIDKKICPTCQKVFEASVRFCPDDATLLVERGGDPMTGKALSGRYTILRKIGEGGMGAVYTAVQNSTGKKVAIKVISKSLAGNEETIRRFEREVKLQSKLEHPNIVNVVDFEKGDHGENFFVMNFVEGKSLRLFILDNGPVSLPLFYELSAQMCDAIDYAHENGIVHRDLKADNMIVVTLKNQHFIKILDFGLAKIFDNEEEGAQKGENLTEYGRILGTPAYMAPEQARGDVANIGPPADVYALGIIFYQMLTGDLPFVSDTPWGVLHKQLNEDPLPIAERNLKVPDALFRVVMACLEKEIDKRPESVHKIKELLESTKNETGEGAQATIFYEDAENLPTINEVEPDNNKKRLGIKMAVGLTIAAVAAIGLMMVTGTGDKDDIPIVAQGQVTAQKHEEPEPPAKTTKSTADLKVPKQADTGEAVDLTKYRGGNGRRGYFGESGPGKIGKKLFAFASGDWVNSSPAIKGNNLYFGCDDNKLFGINKRTGKMFMEFETGEAITGSPVIDKNRLYVTSHDYYAYAIDITNGKILWKFKTGGRIESSPLLDDGVLYVTSLDGNLYAIDADNGKELWRVKGAEKLYAGPSLAGDMVLYSDGNLHAVDKKTGGKKWNYIFDDGVNTHLAVYDNKVYFGSDEGYVYAINSSDGTLAWRAKNGDTIETVPAVAHGVLYAGGMDGNVNAYSAKSGKKYFSVSVGSEVTGAPVVAGDYLYLATKKGELMILDRYSGELLDRFVTGGEINASPVVAEGVIYIGSSDGNLYALIESTDQ